MHRGDRDRGTAEVAGVLLLVPMMVVTVLVLVFVSRQTEAAGTVQHAATIAAQSAARSRSSDGARNAATRAVGLAFSSDGPACDAGPTVEVDLTDWRPGGVVRVDVACAVNRAGLGPLEPPARRMHATAAAIIDRYIGINP